MLDADTGGWLVANRTSDNEAVLRLQSKHRARLAEIRAFNKPPPSKQLAHRWSESPYGSKPHYSHVSRNAKRAQVEGERHQAIERDNLLLLQKMTTLLSSGANTLARPLPRALTVGTWEFAPGVRLNSNQVLVIDHCVSPDPAMPQRRGAARRTLNGGARSAEKRITREIWRSCSGSRGAARTIRAPRCTRTRRPLALPPAAARETARPGFDDGASRPGSVPVRRFARRAPRHRRGPRPHPAGRAAALRTAGQPAPPARLRAAPEGATELWLGSPRASRRASPLSSSRASAARRPSSSPPPRPRRPRPAPRRCRRDHAAGAVVLQAPAPSSRQ